MARRLDRVLVIDLEATCWDGPPPNGEVSEVIEVGVCMLEISTGKRLEGRSILVRPTRSRVSAFCTSLTTLTQEQVDSGVTFAEACATLRKELRSRDLIFASYDDYDRELFQRQCRETGVDYPFGPRHLNVKTIFGLKRRLPHEVGMAEALALMGEPLVGTHHRGGDDAWNIAAILAKLLA